MHRRRRSTLMFTFTRTVQIFAAFGVETFIFEMALLIFKPNLDKGGLAKKILTLIFHFKVVHNAWSDIQSYQTTIRFVSQKMSEPPSSTSFISSDSFNLKKNRRGELLPLRKSKKWPSHCDVLSPLSCLAPAAHCDRRQNRLWSAPKDFQIWRKNRLRSILWISSYWSPGSLEAAHIQLPDNNNSSGKMRLQILKK